MRLRILIADVDEEARHWLRGAHVIEARDGDDLLRLLVHEPLDLAVVGADHVREIAAARQAGSHVPALLIAGAEDEPSQAPLPADAMIVTRPMDEAYLVAAATYLVEHCVPHRPPRG